MKAKIKTSWREASKLHGATAGFVSLVDRGANETPFKEIKSAARKGAGAMPIKKRTDVVKSHKKINTGKKSDPAPVTKNVMAKLVFSQEEFETEAEVMDWLTKSEWDVKDVKVEDDGDGNFVASDPELDEESFKKIAAVEVGEDGVTAFVATIEVKAAPEDDDDDSGEDEDDDSGDDEDDDDAEEAAKAAAAALKTKAKKTAAIDGKKPAVVSKRADFLTKTRDKVVKFDGWDAFFSGESTLAEALKKGMEWDKTPPGFYDVQAAFNGVVQHILGDEAEGVNKEAAMTKAAADYASLLVNLDKFFDAFVNAGEETVKKAVGTDAESIAKWAEDYAMFIAGESTAPAPAKKTVEKKAAEPVVLDTDKIADLITKALAPVVESVSDVTETVAKLAERRPSKKAADPTDQGDGRKKAVKTDDEKTEEWLKSKKGQALIG